MYGIFQCDYCKKENAFLMNEFGFHYIVCLKCRRSTANCNTVDLAIEHWLNGKVIDIDKTLGDR